MFFTESDKSGISLKHDVCVYMQQSDGKSS